MFREGQLGQFQFPCQSVPPAPAEVTRIHKQLDVTQQTILLTRSWSLVRFLSTFPLQLPRNLTSGAMVFAGKTASSIASMHAQLSTGLKRISYFSVAWPVATPGPYGVCSHDYFSH